MARNRKRTHWISLTFWTIVGGALFYAVLIAFGRVVHPLQPSRINNVSHIANPTELTFRPSSEDIANPERGFMKQSSIYVDQPLDATKIRANNPTDTIVWIYFRLDNYRDPRDGYGATVQSYQGRAIDSQGLATIRAAFTTAREKGLKLVIRFIYNPGPGSSSDPQQVNPDVPIDLALQHIGQLKPLLVENADVILAMQGGFVGHWGEWHSSKYLGETGTRKQIVDALLAALPRDRMLLLRYPRYKQVWYGGPLTDQSAYSQSDLARIATHDDAFLKDDTDDGTFKSKSGGVSISSYCNGSSVGETQCWRDYVKQDTRYTAVGGEASVDNPPRSTCANALLQFANMHWSFINNGFNLAVHSSWTAGGCMAEIRQRLGYRFVLNKVVMTRQVNPGGTLGLHLEIDNKGFAALFNPRPAYIVLKNNATGTTRELQLSGVDPRRWGPGQVSDVDANVPIPSDMPAGTYSLYLYLPDAYTSIRARPVYAVRFANLDTWQADTGYNLLYTNLAIGGNIIVTSPNPSPSRSPFASVQRSPIASPLRSPNASRSPAASPRLSASILPSSSPAASITTSTSHTPQPSTNSTVASPSPTSQSTQTPTNLGAGSPESVSTFSDYIFGRNREEKVAADIEQNQQGGNVWTWLRNIGQEANDGPVEGDYNWNGKVEIADLFILIKNIFRR